MRGGNIKERENRSSDGDEEAQWVSKELKTNDFSCCQEEEQREQGRLYGETSYCQCCGTVSSMY